MNIKQFKDPCPGKDSVFMFTTEHQLRTRIFRLPEDFIYGVNTLAIGTLKFRVRILCYTLMDNHLHLLVKGRYEDCLAYFNWVLHRLAMMLKSRYGIRGVLKADGADVQHVKDSQMLLNEVAYLLRNAYKARIDSPFSYEWAPFATIPADWEHVEGRILNKCFVDYRAVEQIVGSGLTLFDRLRRYDLESVIAQSHGMEEQLAFTDSEMQEKVLAVCRNELHVDSPHQLGRKDLLRMARTLAFRFSAPKKQISRLLGIDPEVLESVL